MSFEFEDEKGKVFTEVVTKVPVQVILQTVTHQLIGRIHIRPDQRLKTELDLDEPFLAMTDVSILDADGKTVRRADFLAVRRDRIVWVMPEERDK
ncbi:MAG: hypothetical protein C4583_00290 [Anaerolineaceae bacterium]|nr:MAG: hypothetical protein C4583_00290 [Anaerolineaceae bacterium]